MTAGNPVGPSRPQAGRPPKTGTTGHRPRPPWKLKPFYLATSHIVVRFYVQCHDIVEGFLFRLDGRAVMASLPKAQPVQTLFHGIPVPRSLFRGLGSADSWFRGVPVPRSPGSADSWFRGSAATGKADHNSCEPGLVRTGSHANWESREPELMGTGIPANRDSYEPGLRRTGIPANRDSTPAQAGLGISI